MWLLRKFPTVFFLLVLLAAPAWSESSTGDLSAGRKRPNLLLITFDTTRADRLSTYGYLLPTSPNLTRLAERGVLFSQATAQIPLTGPSHATILTGLYPHLHGAIRNGIPLGVDVPVMTDSFDVAGYCTAAFVSGWTLRANLSGLERGFDVYDDEMHDRYNLVNTQRLANQVGPPALEWLERNHDEPFFLWVHFFDPHAPYDEHDELFDEMKENGEKVPTLPNRSLRYDSEIRFADGWMGRLLDALEEHGVAGNTLVVATADHGESLGEHGYVGHGRRLHEEILHVPLVLSFPGRLPEGKVVDTPVGLIDLTPTILGLMDLTLLPFPDGLDLTPLTGNEPPPREYANRKIYFETYPGARKKAWSIFSPPVTYTPIRAGFREGNLKFVYDVKEKTSALYDLARQDGETFNLIEEHPTYQFRGDELVLWIETSARAPVDDQPPDPEDLERLRALGYLK
jgi:choline-sulfatase